MSRPLFHRNGNWDTQERTLNLSDPHAGRSSFLEGEETCWIDSAKKRLGTSMNLNLRSENPVSHLCSAAECERENWQICLNVSPFTPDQISIKTKDGYLEIAGCQEERQEDHKLISRSFTRKYKIPGAIDLKQIRSMLSPDGILSVTAPLPGSEVPFSEENVIPIQITEQNTQR